jgi:Protein of unknown function (DUF2934)
VGQNSTVVGLRTKADKYRMLARSLMDRETVARIMELSKELEDRALAMEKPTEDEIRTRAYQLWDEDHRPSGRDDEFWFQAERELQQAIGEYAAGRREDVRERLALVPSRTTT